MRLRTRRWGLVPLLATLGLTLGLTAAGAAERPESGRALGKGTRPSIAWTAGTGSSTRHVVWATTRHRADAAAYNAIAYCAISKAGYSCDRQSVLLELPEGGDFSTPQITALPDGTLVITDARCCGGTQQGHYVLESRDRGYTWRVTHPTLLVRSAGNYLSARSELLQVVHPTDGTLSVVGGSVFSLGSPTTFQRISRNQPDPVESPRDDFTGGAARVHAKVLGLLPDGRLFALGIPDTGAERRVYWRAGVAGQDPNSVATGWTPWRRLALPGLPTSIAYGPGHPTWLMFSGAGFAPRIVAFDGRRLGKPRLLGGSVNGFFAAEPELAQDLAMDNEGGLRAVWVTAGEGCPRLKRCLVFRYAPPGKPFEPKQIVRTVPVDGPVIELPEVSVSGEVVWVERTPGGKTSTVHIGNPVYRNVGGGKAASSTLDVPGDPVTGPRFRVGVRGKDVGAVTFTLLPPACPARLGRCYALRKPVVITRRTAPFEATFDGLPEAHGTSTTDPNKNLLCGVDPYLYRVRADVEREAASKGEVAKITLTADVSVCPRVR